MKKTTDNSIEFPNGFASWYETFYEVSIFIEQTIGKSLDREKSYVHYIHHREGTAGLKHLASEWTFEFEKRYQDPTVPVETVWEKDYYEELDEFLNEKNIR